MTHIRITEDVPIAIESIDNPLCPLLRRIPLLSLRECMGHLREKLGWMSTEQKGQQNNIFRRSFQPPLNPSSSSTNEYDEKKIDEFVEVSYHTADTVKHPSLTRDEAAAITLYTSELATNQGLAFYADMNRRLCDPDRTAVKPFAPYLKLFLIALSKLSPTQCVGYRGVSRLYSNDKYCKGEEFIWPTVVSVTTNKELLQTQEYVGKSGVRTIFTMSSLVAYPIGPLSVQLTEEFVLPPLSRFRVRSKVQPGGEVHYITVEQLTPHEDMFAAACKVRDTPVPSSPPPVVSPSPDTTHVFGPPLSAAQKPGDLKPIQHNKVPSWLKEDEVEHTKDNTQEPTQFNKSTEMAAAGDEEDLVNACLADLAADKEEQQEFPNDGVLQNMEIPEIRTLISETVIRRIEKFHPSRVPRANEIASFILTRMDTEDILPQQATHSSVLSSTIDTYITQFIHQYSPAPSPEPQMNRKDDQKFLETLDGHLSGSLQEFSKHSTSVDMTKEDDLDAKPKPKAAPKRGRRRKADPSQL